MIAHAPSFPRAHPLVVGSFGSLQDLLDCSLSEARRACDWLEIRLDVLHRDGWNIGDAPWAHLRECPILFTARCQSEGGVLPLDASLRHAMIEAVIDDAAAVDVELANHQEMAASLLLLREKQVPWIASMHHFTQMPSMASCRDARDLAVELGASVFKLATCLPAAEAITELESLQREASAIAVATMGMGPFAPTSRVRCALAGSVLNYGYIGQAPTAPGQWPAAQLRDAILRREIPALP
jgi:3-dehydroquinate dehydratase type I